MGVLKAKVSGSWVEIGAAGTDEVQIGSTTPVDAGVELWYDPSAATIASPMAASGYRNMLVNGGFDIWQRGIGVTYTGNGGFSADMWRQNRSGSTVAVTCVAFAYGNTIPGYEPTFYQRSVVTSAAGAGNFVVINTFIEGVRAFAGQTVTISFWAKADAPKNIAIEFYQAFAGGSADVSAIGSQLIPLTTTWTRYSRTIAIPSIAGKAIGSVNNALLLQFWYDAGSNFAARAANLGQQSGTFDLWGVQVEAGSIVSPFEVRPPSDIISRCQRYYYRISAPNVVYGSGQAFGTTGAAIVVPLPAMRVSPVIDTTGVPGDYILWNSATAGLALTAVPYIFASGGNFGGAAMLRGDVASGLVAGNATIMLSNSATSYLGFSADF